MRLPTIVHLDADAFFVSVELARRPELRGKKVAVGGRQRGIISSASYEARAAGVYTPMPTQRALKVCPDLVLLPHEGDYGGVSRRMFDLCENITPWVQRNSIDEGYLDLGPCGLKSTEAIANRMRELQDEIWRELTIPISIGMATNRLVAQIASKLRKPRGFVVVPAGEEQAFLAPLDIGVMPGIGKKTAPRLRERGLQRVRDVTALSDSEAAAIFGDHWRALLKRCRGIDDRPVEPDREDAKSYSHQHTFGSDIGDRLWIIDQTKGMIDHLMPKVREDGKRVRTITVKVRYPDFSQASAGHSLPVASDLESAFYPLVEPLLTKAWQRSGSPLRLISVKLSGVDDQPQQLEIFDQAESKRRRAAAVMDLLNARGSGATVKPGHQLIGGDRPRRRLRP